MTPRQPNEYAEVFRSSSIYNAMMQYIKSPTSSSLEYDASEMLAHLPAYWLSFGKSTLLLAKRQLRVYLRNKEFVQSRIVMVIIMGLLYSTSYYQVAADQIVTVIGVIFMAVLFLSLGQFPMIPSILEAKEIYYKQQRANFFKTSSYVLAQSLTQIPFLILETVVFGSIMYWVTGFSATSRAFIVYLLLLFLINVVFATWFFFIAAITPNLNVAQPVSMLSVLVYVLFAGFVMSPDDMPRYFIWIYWIDPLAYAIRALAINQYSTSEFQVCLYKGIDYCKITNTTMGNAMLKQYGVKTDTIWIWYAALYLICCYLLFTGMVYLTLHHVQYESKDHVTPTRIQTQEEELEDKYIEGPKTPVHAIAVPVNESSVRPVVLAFKDLWYSVPNPTKGEPDLQLLKGINGYALP
ncbi:ATP-binding Cassette (ABC) Superfamily, partial [Thraustotheca clavata]